MIKEHHCSIVRCVYSDEDEKRTLSTIYFLSFWSSSTSTDGEFKSSGGVLSSLSMVTAWESLRSSGSLSSSASSCIAACPENQTKGKTMDKIHIQASGRSIEKQTGVLLNLGLAADFDSSSLYTLRSL
jgi:hypothetical protein